MDAVVFAGGKSSRMGKDKSLLPFGSYQTLAEYQYVKLTPYFDNVYLSSKEDKFDFECIVIKDIAKEASPMIGLISIFETLQVEELFILSVDAPFVDEKVIEKILEYNAPEYDSIIAKSPDGVQPLCGIYKRSILPLAYAQLKKGNHRLSNLLALAATCYVPFEEDKPFTNLNHPQEYQKAVNSFESSSE